MAQTKLDNLFQSTPSLRKVTRRWVHPSRLLCQFQSTPSLRKVTNTTSTRVIQRRHFNPHLPCGRWLRCFLHLSQQSNFNPHLPCGRWPPVCATLVCVLYISIHTFLAEGDENRLLPMWSIKISIHTFLAEGDYPTAAWPHIQICISIHTFLAEGDFCSVFGSVFWSISIHTFLAEGDVALQLSVSQ